MALYAFILGRKHLLSIAELCSMFAPLGPKASIVDIAPEAVMVELSEPLTYPQSSLDRLGGTISIAEIFTQSDKDKSAIVPAVSEFLTNRFQGRPNKLNYGISLHSFTERHEEILKKTLISLKKNLTAAEIKSRFINKNFKNAESAAIQGEKLLETGAHIAVIQGNQHYFYGRTVALQNIDKYSKRDYDRPGRDPKLGMLPPKLAQIMINLGGLTRLNEPLKKETILYDPFEGIGTVLTEGLMLGYRVIGSDMNAEALAKAQKNIDWTIEKFTPPGTQYRLFNQDATRLTKKDLPENINLVITESFLGPPVSQFPTPENMRKTFSSINETIYRFFKTIKPLVKKGTPVVISLLAYKRADRYFFMENLVEDLNKLGFRSEPLIPVETCKKYGLKMYQRLGIIYDRPDQIVCREIWKFLSL
jgi:tRNA G10  N-methylase Trm11